MILVVADTGPIHYLVLIDAVSDLLEQALARDAARQRPRGLTP